MEGTGQNFFVSDHLSNLYTNSGAIPFGNLPRKSDFEEVRCEECRTGELLLQDKRSTDQSPNAEDDEVEFHDFAMDLQRAILEEEPLCRKAGSVSSGEAGGAELDSEWDMSMFDDDNSSRIEVEDPNSSADIRFQSDQNLMCLGEESDSNQSTNQDISFIEFALYFQRQLLQDQRSVTPSMSMPESSLNDTRTLENGAAEHVEEAPRPVVAPNESIGVTYHKKNKQWEAHLWLKDQQLRNHRKKKGVQLFLGNFLTADEAKQAHDRAAIKLGVRESSRGKPYPLNFPESAHADYISEHVRWSARDFVWKLRRSSLKFNKGQSRLKGVSLRKGKRGAARYEAKISQTSSEGEKVMFNLGTFESEDAAGQAYDRALLFFKGAEEFTCVTNFQPSGYSADEIHKAGSSLDW